MKPTAVLWNRVSSEGQVYGYSQDSQDSEIANVANGYDVVRTWRITESAKASERRRWFKEMVDFVKANHVDTIIAWNRKRLGRNYKDDFAIQLLIDEYHVTIVLVQERTSVNEKSAPEVRFMFKMMGAFAEYENQNRADETRAKMKEKARQGEVPHLVPIGYLNVRDPKYPDNKRGMTIKDEVRFDLVKWAWEAYDQGGWSYETVAKELNRRGLTTKPGPKRVSEPITVSHLQKIFENPFYYGEFESHGQLWKGNYEPMVSRELWDRVQARRAENKTHSRPSTKKWFLFRPFCKCGFCGKSITAYEQSGRYGRGHYVYYECTSGRKVKDPLWYQKKFGTSDCIQPRWTEDKIAEAIDKELGKLYVDDTVIEEFRERLKRTNVKEEALEKRELNRLEAEKKRKEKHLMISYKDRLDGRITAEQYDGISAETEADLRWIHAEMEKLSRHNIKYREQGSQLLELLRDVKEVYRRADPKGKRRLLEIMLDEILLLKEPSFAWRYPFNTLFALGKVFRERGIWGE